MTLEDKVQAQRLHVFRRARELGNVSAACREAGISRARFYELRKRYERYGVRMGEDLPVDTGARLVGGAAPGPGQLRP